MYLSVTFVTSADTAMYELLSLFSRQNWSAGNCKALITRCLLLKTLKTSTPQVNYDSVYYQMRGLVTENILPDNKTSLCYV